MGRILVSRGQASRIFQVALISGGQESIGDNHNMAVFYFLAIKGMS